MCWIGQGHSPQSVELASVDQYGTSSGTITAGGPFSSSGSTTSNSRRTGDSTGPRFTQLSHPFTGWLGLLTRRATKDQRQADLVDLAGIATTMHRLERLITDLMDTARLSQGLFTLTKQPIDLTGLVEEVALMHSTPFVQIDVQMPEEQVAWVDADRLRQALENVLSNAVKHTQKGTTVLVQAEMHEKEGGIVLSISDHGPGVPSEVLPTLFEPFRAGSDTGGLGLGLYLAQQIARAHGGCLSLDTAYREGARFLLFLPIHDVNPSEPLEKLS